MLLDLLDYFFLLVNLNEIVTVGSVLWYLKLFGLVLTVSFVLYRAWCTTYVANVPLPPNPPYVIHVSSNFNSGSNNPNNNNYVPNDNNFVNYSNRLSLANIRVFIYPYADTIFRRYPHAGFFQLYRHRNRRRPLFRPESQTNSTTSNSSSADQNSAQNSQELRSNNSRSGTSNQAGSTRWNVNRRRSTLRFSLSFSRIQRYLQHLSALLERLIFIPFPFFRRNRSRASIIRSNVILYGRLISVQNAVTNPNDTSARQNEDRTEETGNSGAVGPVTDGPSEHTYREAGNEVFDWDIVDSPVENDHQSQDEDISDSDPLNDSDTADSLLSAGGTTVRYSQSETLMMQDECSCHYPNGEGEVKAGEPKPVSFVIKFLNDSQINVTTTLDEKVDEFKKKHFASELSQNKTVRLIFNGKVLENDTQTLGQSGIYDECVVHCLIVNKQSRRTAGSEREVHLPDGEVGNAVQNENQGVFPAGEPGLFFIGIMGVILALMWFICFNFGQQLFAQSAIVSLTGLTAIFLVGVIAFYVPIAPSP